MAIFKCSTLILEIFVERFTFSCVLLAISSKDNFMQKFQSLYGIIEMYDLTCDIVFS